ncbi:sigma-70 family RNA polymerase sigma factor [Paenibacillus sp. N1-5-1-14]|uniref:sigma-70 family RNA polymerase sigma factor n=1 Tax=Paenibacillus radicibacter TaxID=2972488 RepID=UPI00215914A2|nr:sigma-70 family RNA polymerase sigma factor [Paenibacillus radicibacter]MCR8643294.1 sigma-70 family RNA polymerase sigma factor [Paenibacillus radicibacter]
MHAKIELVERAKNGDKDAFQALIHEEKEKLYKMAFVYMRKEEDALEVFQETIYKALTAIGSLKDNAYFSSWLVRILIHTAIATLNKKRRVIPLNQEVLEQLVGSGSLKLEDQIDLLQALEELDEKYKTVLMLRFYKDYTIKQIAAIVECPEGTVKTNLHRGLMLLRTRLKGAYSDEREGTLI